MPTDSRPIHRRGAAVQVAVLETVIELLSELGYGFSIDEVASRAGVHTTTLYRNWVTKPQLVAAAISRIAARDIVVRRGRATFRFRLRCASLDVAHGGLVRRWRCCRWGSPGLARGR